VNCNQARAMLAAYRELKNGEVDTIELDVHLESCASCRQELARYMLIGEQIRSLPMVEPLPDMHAKLMQALAQEQVELIWRSKPGTVSTPEFLKPYIQEHAQSTHHSAMIAAFSSAETGPLPVIQVKRKPRHRSHMSQFAVLGLAAMFLVVLMMGGLTSLLLLAHNNLQPAITYNSSSVHRQTEVVQAQYSTSALYQHVVSAVADNAYIYYTAENRTNASWMLERLDRTTQTSTPLFPTASTNPLIILGSSNGGLVWLQFDGLKLKPHKNLPGYNEHPFTNLWSLHYLSPGQQQQAALGIPTDSEVLLKGVFDQDLVPSWVTTPVQGIWFVQNSLLVASIDNSGVSHLVRYQLGTVGKQLATEIATATPDHILTSPTANSDGTQIFWSEEWLTNTDMLSSNIWTQQVVDAPRPTHGRWAAGKVELIVKQPFTSDGMSFRPQVANNTLFMLRTASQANSTQGTPTTKGTATPAPTPSPNTTVISRIDQGIYAAPLDASIRGTILMLPLDGAPTVPPTVLNNTGLASSLQAGADFALWQDDKGYVMYDVQSQSFVNMGDTLNGASFVAVNGNTTVWTLDSGGTNSNVNTRLSTNLYAFNWPNK
jgi:negative regulator of sigma E activity